MSHNMQVVHSNILDDLLFPAKIVGKRIRIKLDGTRLLKCHLADQHWAQGGDKKITCGWRFKRCQGVACRMKDSVLILFWTCLRMMPNVCKWQCVQSLHFLLACLIEVNYQEAFASQFWTSSVSGLLFDALILLLTVATISSQAWAAAPSLFELLAHWPHNLRAEAMASEKWGIVNDCASEIKYFAHWFLDFLVDSDVYK